MGLPIFLQECGKYLSGEEGDGSQQEQVYLFQICFFISGRQFELHPIMDFTS